MASGPAKRITVARDEKVFHAVAERLQCKLRQLKRIEFGGTPLPPTEHLTFDSIGMEDDGRLGVDIRTEVVDTLQGHTFYVHSVCALPDGILASGSGDKSIKIWDISSGECIQTLNGHTDCVSSVCVLPDGNLASGSYKSIKIWDI